MLSPVDKKERNTIIKIRNREDERALDGRARLEVMATPPHTGAGTTQSPATRPRRLSPPCSKDPQIRTVSAKNEPGKKKGRGKIKRGGPQGSECEGPELGNLNEKGPRGAPWGRGEGEGKAGGRVLPSSPTASPLTTAGPGRPVGAFPRWALGARPRGRPGARQARGGAGFNGGRPGSAATRRMAAAVGEAGAARRRRRRRLRGSGG